MKMTITKSPWAYFLRTGNGQIHLFDTTECENCGETIEAPNAIGSDVASIESWKRGGAVEWTGPRLEEGYYSDDVNDGEGGEACYNCNG